MALLKLLCCAVLWLAANSTAFALNNEHYVFAITEGGASHIVGKDVAPRYKELASELSRLLKKPVDIDVVVDYKALAKGLASDQYELAFIHPTQIAMAALGSKKYRYIASEKYHVNYQVQLFVTGKSPLKTLADLNNPLIRDKTLVAPMEDSVTSAIARVMFKETMGSVPQVSYTNQEDTLPFSSENGAVELESMLFLLKNGLGAVGASASLSVVNDWKAAGGRVIGSSPKVPVKSILASAKLSDAEREKVSAYFLGLDKTEAGAKLLQRLGFTGFTALEQVKVNALIQWFAR